MAELSRPSDIAADQAIKPQVAAPARRLDIISHRNVFFLISLIIIVPGIIAMVTRGFLLGIDFQGGSEFFISFPDNRPTLAAVEAAVASEGVNGQVQQTSNGTFIIRTSVLDPNQAKRFTDDIGRRVGSTVRVDQQNQVGGTIASETVTTALLAIVLNFGWARRGSMLGVARGRA